MKSLRRSTLMKMIDKGEIEAKCEFRLTDDYGYDNASNFGKTGWLKARIRRPIFQDVDYGGFTRTLCIDSDTVEGKMNFTASDFKYNGGGCYWNDDGTIRFRVMANEVYTLRVVEK